MFKKYRRTNVAEMRPVVEGDLINFHNTTEILEAWANSERIIIGISEEDLKNGSPLLGDMIARNPENHKDQWLIAEKYSNANFELMENNES